MFLIFFFVEIRAACCIEGVEDMVGGVGIKSVEVEEVFPCIWPSSLIAMDSIPLHLPPYPLLPTVPLVFSSNFYSYKPGKKHEFIRHFVSSTNWIGLVHCSAFQGKLRARYRRMFTSDRAHALLFSSYFVCASIPS